MNPVTNFEKWINSIATGEAPGILPVTRLEHFLNKIRMSIARKNDIKKEVPAVENADKGKYLHANDSTGALEWAAAGGSSLPEYDSDDIGKSLSVVDSGETEVVTRIVTVIESQTPTSIRPAEYSILGTAYLSEIEVGDTVNVTINETEKACEVYAGYGDRKDIRYYTDETHHVTITEDGDVWDDGTNIDLATAVISATMAKEVEIPVPAIEWNETGGGETATFIIDGKNITASENVNTASFFILKYDGGPEEYFATTINKNDLAYQFVFVYESLVVVDVFFDEVLNDWTYLESEYTLTPAK